MLKNVFNVKKWNNLNFYLFYKVAEFIFVPPMTFVYYFRKLAPGEDSNYRKFIDFPIVDFSSKYIAVSMGLVTILFLFVAFFSVGSDSMPLDMGLVTLGAFLVLLVILGFVLLVVLFEIAVRSLKAVLLTLKDLCLEEITDEDTEYD